VAESAKKSHLTFEHFGSSESGKTDVYRVTNAVTLGMISWYAPWRKYTFHPAGSTVFDPGCLRDIADFCEHLTDWTFDSPK
jgi:hypothetical protein